MIVDLDISPIFGKKEKKPYILPEFDMPEKKEPTKKVEAPKKADIADEKSDRKQYLLNQISEKESYIRHQRSMVHRKYRDLLDPNLLPKKGTESEMSELYEQIDSFTEDLKNLYIKKQQVEKFGDIREQKILTNEDFARIAALKHRRSRVNDNLYKTKKNLAIAEGSGNKQKEKNAILKIERLELEYLEIANELKKLQYVK